MKDELGVFPILKLKTNISIVKTEKKNKQTNKQNKDDAGVAHILIHAFLYYLQIKVNPL